MSCARYREALSALLDGEDPGLDQGELRLHLQGCPGCLAWKQSAAQVSRQARLHDATSVPDLTGPITAALRARPTRARRVRWAQAGLAAVAVAQLGLAVPTLVGLTHLSHETAAFEIALALGLLTAALRPVRAAVMLPVVAAAVLVLGLVGWRDIAAGQVEPTREAGHLLLATAVLLLLVLRRRTRPDTDDGPVRAAHPAAGGQHKAA